jgi:hypothetical protein
MSNRAQSRLAPTLPQPKQCATAHAGVLWVLAGLFSARVSGQALQHWAPLPFLPPFEAFQGSGLPYLLLLSAQLAILGWMCRLAWRVSAGTLLPRHRTGRILARAGWLYFICMLVRLTVGLAFDTGSPWFEAWIPAAFHMVLAAFVLTLAAYHRGCNRFDYGELQ